MKRLVLPIAVILFFIGFSSLALAQYCHTIVTVSVSPSSIYAGNSITISGRVYASTSCAPDPPVQLYLDDGYIGTVNTDSSGYYSFSYTTSNSISSGSHTIKTVSKINCCSQGYGTATFYVNTQICTPGEIRNRVCLCSSQYQYEQCNSQGTGWNTQTGNCPSGQVCENGNCIAKCNAQYLDQWQCSGNWRQRKYQNSDCTYVWQDYEYCSNGCSSGECERCSAHYTNNWQCSGNWRQQQYIDEDCDSTWKNSEYCPYGCSGGSCQPSCHDWSCGCRDWSCGCRYPPCDQRPCSISASVTTPGDTYVDKIVSTTVTFTNRGDSGGYVNFNVYLCRDDYNNCVSMICEDDNYRVYRGDPRVYVMDHDSRSLTCTATVTEPCNHRIKVEYYGCNDDPIVYSGVFEVRNRYYPRCAEQYLSNYDCSGNWRRQQYQDSDCSVEWKTIEYCDKGCSAGSCSPVATTTTIPTGGSPLVSVRKDYSVNRCEINSFDFDVMNVGPSQATFDIKTSGSAADWIRTEPTITLEKNEKKSVTAYASVPCDAKGDYDFTMTASGATSSSATSYLKIVEPTKPFVFTGFAVSGGWVDWLMILLVILLLIALLLLIFWLLGRRRGCRRGLFRRGCNAESF